MWDEDDFNLGSTWILLQSMPIAGNMVLNMYQNINTGVIKTITVYT